MHAEIDLELLTFGVMRELPNLLSAIEAVATDMPQFALTPQKGYYARADVPVLSDGLALGSGKLVLLAFQMGDGTGNRDNYTIERRYPSWTPREKKGVAELFMSVGTFYRNAWIPCATSLDAVTMNDNKTDIVTYSILTMAREKHLGLLDIPQHAQSMAVHILQESPYAFTYDKVTSPLIGDPHAIVFRPQNYEMHSGVVQVGAFLEFPFATHALAKVRSIVESKKLIN